MFDFQTALLPLNGQRFSVSELQRRLSNLRLDHQGEIAPEIGVRELLLVALKHGWVVEETDGQLSIRVPDKIIAA